MNTSTPFCTTHFYRALCRSRCRAVWTHHNRFYLISKLLVLYYFFLFLLMLSAVLLLRAVQFSCLWSRWLCLNVRWWWIYNFSHHVQSCLPVLGTRGRTMLCFRWKGIYFSCLNCKYVPFLETVYWKVSCLIFNGTLLGEYKNKKMQ